MAYYLNILLCIFVILYCFSVCEGYRPRRKKPNDPERERRKKATRYLTEYGYYQSWVTNKYYLKEAVKFFQTFNKMEVTGKLDDAVLQRMKVLRCGVSDPDIRFNYYNDMKYFTHGTRWNARRVTWHWDGKKYSNQDKLTTEVIFTTLRQAFAMWSDVSALTFKEIKQWGNKRDRTVEARTTNQKGKRKVEPNIVIEFSPSKHGDPFPFSASGKSIAHAFYPHGNHFFHGDIHFFDGKTYTLGSTSGSEAVNFLWVAAHEIGHSLGLMHSPDPNSIMYPWYNSTHPVLTLHQNDIEAVQVIYGSKVTSTTTTVATTTVATTKVAATTAAVATTQRTTWAPEPIKIEGVETEG